MIFRKTFERGESLENRRENWEFIGENIGGLLEKILGIYDK